MGDTNAPDTDFGPLARADLRERLQDQMERSIRLGASLLLGGAIPLGHGFYYPTTILTDVRPGMPAADEELFGPVAAIIPVRNEEEAITVANNTPYGLGAVVFTERRAHGIDIATRRLEAGMAFVNDYVRSDLTLPFGGIKQSGYGRELGILWPALLRQHQDNLGDLSGRPVVNLAALAHAFLFSSAYPNGSSAYPKRHHAYPLVVHRV